MDATMNPCKMERSLDNEYPERPRNHSKTPAFSTLCATLLNPLKDTKKPAVQSRRAYGNSGRLGKHNSNPQELRYNLVTKFISQWRQDVGNDIWPALRLILPDKDRERPMYGLKEHVISRLLIKVLNIDKDSTDGLLLRNWKQPEQFTMNRTAGDFAGRCFEALSRRPLHGTPGDMSIEKVNEELDRLAAAEGQAEQVQILGNFYKQMSAEEMMWLIRIILRQIKIGTSEKLIFSAWHPDAEALFNISSNLRRICWELWDPKFRLHQDRTVVGVMQCFQPQLAQFQMQSLPKMVQRMKPAPDDTTFYIEEKLDGERMQLHMEKLGPGISDVAFRFWSRKGKEYTDHYGSCFTDGRSTLTRHLRHAFAETVESIILDGEMITWDMQENVMAPFGTLKTAVKEQQDNPYAQGLRPVYKVFDILFLNGHILTNYTLRDRKNALRTALVDIPRRIEVHDYLEASDVQTVEKMLRKIVADASEGLVLKNPRSPYRLNARSDDWIKVKPEYMDEFGENLDCLIIGGYYGSGHRGGKLSSFLCGLRADSPTKSSTQESTATFFSFFRVGGGFTGSDYAAIRHKTEGKWRKWDSKQPPADLIILAGEHRQIERPDEWINPMDSIVVEVKAASVAASESFRVGLTLRFPRFKRIRDDRNWEDALSLSEFMLLKNNAESEHAAKQFRVDDSRKRRRQSRPMKKPLKVLGSGCPTTCDISYQSSRNIFRGLQFFVMTGHGKSSGQTKVDIEQMIKSNGGKIVQAASTYETICIGQNKTVQVASLMRQGDRDIVRPTWIFDNITESVSGSLYAGQQLLPYEPRHLFFARPHTCTAAAGNVDALGDGFFCDLTQHSLEALVNHMSVTDAAKHQYLRLNDLGDNEGRSSNTRCSLFERIHLWVVEDVEFKNHTQSSNSTNLELQSATRLVRFGGGTVDDRLGDKTTHVLCAKGSEHAMHMLISSLARRPRRIDLNWIEASWRERTLLDESRPAIREP